MHFLTFLDFLLVTTLNTPVDHQCELYWRAKALSLMLMAKLILNRIAVILRIKGHCNLDLDSYRFIWGNFTDLDFFGQIKRIRASREDEIGILGPIYRSIIFEDILLFNYLSGCHSKLVLVLERLETIAEHLLHLLCRIARTLRLFWTITTIYNHSTIFFDSRIVLTIEIYLWLNQDKKVRTSLWNKSIWERERDTYCSSIVCLHLFKMLAFGLLFLNTLLLGSQLVSIAIVLMVVVVGFDCLIFGLGW